MKAWKHEHETSLANVHRRKNLVFVRSFRQGLQQGEFRAPQIGLSFWDHEMEEKGENVCRFWELNDFALCASGKAQTDYFALLISAMHNYANSTK